MMIHRVTAAAWPTGRRRHGGPRRRPSASALLEAERDENVCRKDMLPSEKVALGAAL